MDIAVDAPAALQGGQSRYLTKRLFSMAEVDMAGALQRLQESMDKTRLTLTQKVDALHAEIKAQERRIDDALSSQQETESAFSLVFKNQFIYLSFFSG